MPQSDIFDLDDPERFETAIRAGTAKVFVKSRGDFQGQLTRIDLQRLWMQRSDTNLPYIMNVANDPERAPLVFLADDDQAPVGANGRQVSPGEILVYRQGAEWQCSTSGPSRLATISLAHEDLAAAGKAIAGHDLATPLSTYRTRPDPAAMTLLRALHKAAAELARTSPDVLATAGVAQALEQKLVRAMVACLSSDAAAERKSCDWQHSRVIGRFERFLEANRYQPVYLAEMCAAIGASERTLRTCCQEHFGMGPVRYLWLRRMHLARRALLRADASAATVTTVATDHGFWELGRFSVEYSALFGESPSASLRRPLDAMPARNVRQ
jgi:AraC-like DNA-binding protein